MLVNFAFAMAVLALILRVNLASFVLYAIYSIRNKQMRVNSKFTFDLHMPIFRGVTDVQPTHYFRPYQGHSYHIASVRKA
jgi:hypothetical protein